jgi:hypothetical protein
MTWDAYNRRKTVLRELLEVADLRRDGVLPWDARVEQAFENPTELLFDLQMYWFQRLSGEVDRRIDRGDVDPEAAAVSAWRQAAASSPGARAILDAHDDDPLLAKAHAKELSMLAHAAGRAPLWHPSAPAIGARLRAEARAIRIEDAPSAGTHGGWMLRLRQALVA